MDEQVVVQKFNDKINKAYIWANCFHLPKKYPPALVNNLKYKNREFDIMLYNFRTVIGTFVRFGDFEIECRGDSNDIINRKYNNIPENISKDTLLSFIFSSNNNRHSFFMNSEKCTVQLFMMK